MKPKILKQLIAALPREHDQHILRLINKKIDKQGAKIVSHYITHHPEVSVVYMCHNLIDDEGAQHIAEALKNSGVTHLSLQYNSIGDLGCAALANAIPETSMVEVNLNYNHITCASDKTFLAVYRMLSAKNLEYVSFVGNGIDKHAIEKLHDVLRTINFMREARGNDKTLNILTSESDALDHESSTSSFDDTAAHQDDPSFPPVKPMRVPHYMHHHSSKILNSLNDFVSYIKSIIKNAATESCDQLVKSIDNASVEYMQDTHDPILLQQICNGTLPVMNIIPKHTLNCFISQKDLQMCHHLEASTLGLHALLGTSAHDFDTA